MADTNPSPTRVRGTGADIQTAAAPEESKVETTDTVTTAAEPEIDPADLKFREVEGIRYTGTADFKHYSKADLAQLGHDKAEDDGVTWTPAQRELPKSHFNAAALREIVAQSDFEAF